MSDQNIGTVAQIIGPVLDIKFHDGHLPGLLNAVTVEDGGRRHDGWRWRSTSATTLCAASPWPPPTALQRGATATRTRAAPITVPVGEQTPGPHLQPAGRAGGQLPAPGDCRSAGPSTASRPAYDEQQSTTEILETGIKVIDLICPLRQGRQDRPVRRRGRGQDRADHGADQQRRQASTAASRCSPAWASAPARATTCTTR